MNEHSNTEGLLRQIEWLSKEVARLRVILSAHGISYELQPVQDAETAVQSIHSPQNYCTVTKEQILKQRKELFRSLFKGREDVFALRWTSCDGSKAGYMPVCSNRWTTLCDKKKYKCANCPNRQFVPLGSDEIEKHLRGADECGKPYTIGVYAILTDDTCNFLCADFDDKSCEHGYQQDVLAFVGVCKDWDIPYSIERSRSGNGAHVWILFERPVAAGKARRLGDAILTEAMNRDARLSFKSYDRFFPNQDHLPEGGFGNLVALPLQGLPRKKGNSVFVNERFESYPNQWEYLSSVRKIPALSIDKLLAVHAGKSDFGELSKTSVAKPWETPAPLTVSKEYLPSEITIVRSNMLYIPIKGISSKVINHLKHIASFKNPEFGARLGMHLSTYHVPRVISCADVTDEWLAMPRGCEDAVAEFFEENAVSVEVEDRANDGHLIDVSFKGILRQEQAEAINQLMSYDNGVLSGTTAFGKTVAAIGLIARRKVNTLILVHNKALAKQWRERIGGFLAMDYAFTEPPVKRGRKRKRPFVGLLSSEENTLNGNIDIALLQSCISGSEVKSFVRNYGMVIVDECHHVSAANFEQVLKYANARYVYGLTATPIRKDGHQPIIFMQCGPIRFTEDAAAQIARQNFRRILIPRFTTYRQLGEGKLTYNQTLHELTVDKRRNQQIVDDVANVLKEGRTPIVITKLVGHVALLAELIRPICNNLIVLVGSVSSRERKVTEQQLQSISPNEPMVIVASLSYIAEGFDLPRLDTLLLAQPVSYKGLVAQYTGRLHRSYEGKTEVRIYDYVDIRQPMCETMYKRRLRGYAAVGYKVQTQTTESCHYADMIYTGENFEQTFLADLASAKHSIVLACPVIKFYRHPTIIQKLMEQQARGVSIYVHVRKEGYDEQKFREVGGTYTANDSLAIQCAIIDKSLCWYGDINFLGYHSGSSPNCVGKFI